MKKSILLAGAALLSTVAMGTNATELKDNQTTLDIYATLFAPVSIDQISPLSFGAIQIGPNSAGKKVVVGTDDALAATGTTADLIVSTNLGDAVYSGDIRSGKLEVTGLGGEYISTSTTALFDSGATSFSNIMALSFTDAELVPDGSGSGLDTCGKVSDFEYVMTPDDSDTNMTVSVGATLQLASDFSNMTPGIALVCKGETVVTWFADTETIMDALYGD